MTQSNTETEFVDFMHFWEWEYTRRNERWRDTFVEQTSARRMYSDNGGDFYILSIGPFHGVCRCGSGFYSDVDSIISALPTDHFCYRTPAREDEGDIFNPLCYDNEYMNYDDSMSLDDNLQKYEIDRDGIYKQLGLSFENGDRLLCFNVAAGNKDAFFSFVDSLIVDNAVFEEAKKEGKPNPGLEVSRSEEYQSAWARYESSKIKKMRGKIRKWKNNKQRAIGLWLFDYCVANKCGGPTAFAALRATDYLETLNFQTAIDDDRPLERWLTGTRACVKAGKVLPLIG